MMTPVEDMSFLTSFMFTGCELLPKSSLSPVLHRRATRQFLPCR
jgi:hypothetical protein